MTPELKVVLEEQNQRVANNPRARLGEQIEAALYLNHPYGRPVIGWRHEIEKLNREDALAFYRRFYTPNNAILVVAGDVTADEVKALAEETYGKVAPVAEIGPRVRPQEPAPGRGPPRHARRSARRAAEPAALLSRAVRSHRQAGRSRGARRAGPHPRQRQHQPALSHAGGRARARGQRRRLVQRHGARRDAVQRLRLAQAGRHAAAARSRRSTR